MQDSQLLAGLVPNMHCIEATFVSQAEGIRWMTMVSPALVVSLLFIFIDTTR